MAKNKVQFQKSMNIHAFIKRYGSEDLCQQRLFDIRWPQGFRCPNCGGLVDQIQSRMVAPPPAGRA